MQAPEDVMIQEPEAERSLAPQYQGVLSSASATTSEDNSQSGGIAYVIAVFAVAIMLVIGNAARLAIDALVLAVDEHVEQVARGRSPWSPYGDTDSFLDEMNELLASPRDNDEQAMA
jgi:hypothetical protein